MLVRLSLVGPLAELLCIGILHLTPDWLIPVNATLPGTSVANAGNKHSNGCAMRIASGKHHGILRIQSAADSEGAIAFLAQLAG